MSEKKRERQLHLNQWHIGYHIIMIIWSLVAMTPVWILIINTFKNKREIYSNPFGLPQSWTFDNYSYVLRGSDFLAFGREEEVGGY